MIDMMLYLDEEYRENKLKHAGKMSNIPDYDKESVPDKLWEEINGE
jgi:hypothetical protein